MLHPLSLLTVFFNLYWEYTKEKDCVSLSIRDEVMKDYIDLEKERKTQKLWRIAFFFYVGSPLFFCLHFLIVEIIRDPTKPDAYFGIALLLYVFFLLVFPTSKFVYGCAYHRRGVALLTWILFIMAIQIAVFLHKSFQFMQKEPNLIFWLRFSTFLALQIFYWVSCLRLRRVNAERKRQINLILETIRLSRN